MLEKTIDKTKFTCERHHHAFLRRGRYEQVCITLKEVLDKEGSSGLFPQFKDPGEVHITELEYRESEKPLKEHSGVVSSVAALLQSDERSMSVWFDVYRAEGRRAEEKLQEQAAITFEDDRELTKSRMTNQGKFLRSK